MLKFFVDDSGSDPSRDGLFVLYGYSMEEPRWEDFAERWDEQLKRPGFFPIDYFRMADAEAGTGQFAGIDNVFRKRKVRDLAEVIHQCNPVPIGCKMTWKDYNEIMRGKVHPDLDNPYSVMFFQVLRGVTEIQITLNAKVPEDIKSRHGIAIKPVDFIFDTQGPAGLKCLQWFGPLQSRLPEPHRTVLSNTPQFRDDRELVSLQAADMLAWHIRRDFEYPSENRKDIFDLIAQDGMWEGEITPSMLRQVVDVFNEIQSPTQL